MPILGSARFATFLPISTNTFASTSEYVQVDKRIVIRVTYCDFISFLQYILLKKSLEQQFPNCLHFEEDISEQATGEFEVFVDEKLVHSKKVILSKGPRQGRRLVVGSWIVGDTHVCALSPLCPER
ncbi:Selenoprotein V [Myotis davidii]|uniref:Selenoprotein V n=1 Tax=Myotis davidii TaxID=225400 RepID=L5LEJ1_MYODS|nr:Selenoprotein V [Myotis davidii]